MKYKRSTDDGPLVLHTFQDSVFLKNEEGFITLSWDEVHVLVELFPKAIKDAIKTYWPN